MDASALAMVSMTWKNVTGSVSIPLVERGSSSRNSCASCSLSSSAGGSRREVSISLGSCRDVGTHGLGPGDHRPVAGKIGRICNRCIQDHVCRSIASCVPVIGRKGYRAIAAIGKSMATRSTSANKRLEISCRSAQWSPKAIASAARPRLFGFSRAHAPDLFRVLR